jgi:hypothetical protein
LNQITRDNPIEAMSATRCFAAIQTMAQDLAYTLVTAKGKWGLGKFIQRRQGHPRPRLWLHHKDNDQKTW